ncbi:MAG: dynamin family protein [Prevotella sp.]|nr:dynamin family protein [Prevotella sp.]
MHRFILLAMSEKANIKKIESISAQLGELASVYMPRLTDENIRHKLSQLSRRSLEYKNGSFIMLVVGPVKSGKSTLVNLLAHRYVSPTDTLECTVRPSIISNVEHERDCKIEIYKARHEGRKAEDLDLIIDELRGIVTEHELEEYLEKDEYLNYSDETINNVISPSYNKEDRTIITSITTTGSKLLERGPVDGGKIFLADMPGFDGNTSNLNDPLYDAISKRVDLILFVHSSVSAFNLTSASYLEKLREYNEAVPVYLVHNIFDSTYWKNTEEREGEIDRQVQKEYEEIRSKGFNIESEFISKVNLGKVTDALSGTGAYVVGFEDDLQVELRKFEEIEEKLYKKITSNISELRLKRCEDRTRTLRDMLVDTIAKEISSLQQKKNARDAMAHYVDNLEKELSITMHEQDEIIGAVESSANRSVFRTISTTQVNRSASTEECVDILKAVLVQFLSDVDQKLSLNLFSMFKNKEESFRALVAEKTGLDKIPMKITPAEAATAKNIYDEDVSTFMNKKYFEFLRDMWHGTHAVKDIKSYISKMENYFYGTKESPSTYQLKELLKKEIKRLEALYLREIKAQYAALLPTIITDEQSTSLDTLEKLKIQLTNILI